MKPPCEIVTKKLLPAIRALVVKELAGDGCTQARIAGMLNISQPAVNYYLKLIEKKQLERMHPLVRDPDIRRAAKEIIKSIRETGNVNESIALTCNLCREMRISGPICAMHRTEITSIVNEQTCGLCHLERRDIERVGRRVEVISELARAAGVLEGEAISDLIPEIGMNIAYATDKPGSSGDVASFPGRIIRVKGRASAIGIPEFGISTTLSAILIKLSRLGSKKRCLIYVKNTEKVKEAVRKLKLAYVETEHADKDWSAALEQIGRKDLKHIDVILDAGGMGLEPLAYIFAVSPAEAIEKLKKISGFMK